MNPYIILVAVLAMCGAGFGGFKLGVDHEKAGQLEKAELVAEAVDAANSASAAAISALKIKNTTIKNEAVHEVRTNTIYTDCKLTSGGLRLANQALDPSAALSLGDGKLPQANTAE